MSINLDVKLKKANKVYHEGENISGVVVISSPSDIKHDGISLTMEGTVNLLLSGKNVGIFDAFYNSAKPIQLVHCSIEVAAPGKIPSGKTEIPFEFPLKPRGQRTLYETYHGVFVNIQYLLRCEMKRSFLAKDLCKVAEFIVEYKENAGEKAIPHPVSFTMSPESLQNVRDREKARVPRFCITGKVDSTVCCVTKPFTGMDKVIGDLRRKTYVLDGTEVVVGLNQNRKNGKGGGILWLVVEHCEMPIKSVELQLVRVETCGCAEGYARDATEIQNIQIGEGDVACGVAIPIYMVFPRLFTCPTLTTSNFKVEFEVNVVILFQDDHLVTENFPIVLTRH